MVGPYSSQVISSSTPDKMSDLEHPALDSYDLYRP
jgi:hypothetical protein